MPKNVIEENDNFAFLKANGITEIYARKIMHEKHRDILPRKT
jgi:hypothetical protein